MTKQSWCLDLQWKNSPLVENRMNYGLDLDAWRWYQIKCLLKSLNTSIRYQKHFLSTMFLCLCVCTQIYLVQCHYSAFLIALHLCIWQIYPKWLKLHSKSTFDSVHAFPGNRPMTYCLNWRNSSALFQLILKSVNSLHAGPVAQTVAQCCGFDTQVMHELIKCMHWMQCKLLVMKASAKCINVTLEHKPVLSHWGIL